jgi:hypothetical protein
MSDDVVKPYWERCLSYCSPSPPESILSQSNLQGNRRNLCYQAGLEFFDHTRKPRLQGLIWSSLR